VKNEEKKLESYTEDILKEKEAKIAELKKYLPKQSAEIQNNKENPKELCKLMAKAQEVKEETSKERKEMAKAMLNLLEKYQDKKELTDFDPNKASIELFGIKLGLENLFFSQDVRITLYYILRKTNYKSGLTFEQVKAKAKSEIEKTLNSTESSFFNLNLLSECGNLPDKENHSMKCYELGMLMYGKVTFELVKSASQKESRPEINTCIKHFIKDQILQSILNLEVEKLLKVLLNIYGAMFFGLMKSLYYSIRMLISYARSTDSTKTVSEKSQHLGEVAGFAVKMILSTMGMKKRKRMMLKKMKKFKK
jgi:hypothetical protein